MRTHCSFGVRWPLLAGLATSLVIAVACSEATAPVIPAKYIVTTFNSTAPAGDTVVFKAQLADVNDHSAAIAGKHVNWYANNGAGQFSSSMTVTDADGIATNYFIAGPKAGVTADIAVVDEDRLQGRAAPIKIVAGEPAAYAVTTSSTTPVIGTTITVTAQLTDKAGNQTPIAGRVVVWSIPDNGGYYQIGVRANRLVAPSHRPRLSTETGTFSSPTSTTNSQGVATVDFQVGTVVNSTYVINAVDGLGAVGNSPPITVHAGPIAKFTVTVSFSDPPAGATIVLSAVASDAYGNAITGPGIPVQWSATGGSLSSTSSTTGQTGSATIRLTTGPTPGTSYTVTASNAQSNATGSSPTITTLAQVSLASLASGFGSESSCGIATDARAWCWGTQGVLPARPIPGQPIGDRTVSALSTNSHTCAISSGIVICWGPNDYGQLGDGTTTSRTTPAPIASSLSFTAVSTGAAHTCALATTGDIYCWGLSQDGRLGDGTGYTGSAPIKVAAPVSFTALTAGRAHTCAISTAGDAYCWGANDGGQLGNGSQAPESRPTLVIGAHKFTAISAGESHTCAIAADAVYCWGDNTVGQIGNGTSAFSTVEPSQVRNSSSFVTVSAGGFHTCAIESGGRAWCWGDNTTAELGDPDFVQGHASVPIPVAGGLSFKSITVGGSANYNDYYYGLTGYFGYSCGITTDGVTYCWGQNVQGELGTSDFTPSKAVPTKVDGQH